MPRRPPAPSRHGDGSFVLASLRCRYRPRQQRAAACLFVSVSSCGSSLDMKSVCEFVLITLFQRHSESAAQAGLSRLFGRFSFCARRRVSPRPFRGEHGLPRPRRGLAMTGGTEAFPQPWGDGASAAWEEVQEEKYSGGKSPVKPIVVVWNQRK